MTIIYISHKLDEVFRNADRITVLRDGKVVQTLDRDGDVAQRDHAADGRPRDRPCHVSQLARSPGDDVLRVEQLSLPWPGHARQWRLDRIDLCVRKGEVLGIAGLMGAGRTELYWSACMAAARSAPLGRLALRGREVHFEHPSEAHCAQGVAMVTEDRKRYMASCRR